LKGVIQRVPFAVLAPRLLNAVQSDEHLQPGAADLGDVSKMWCVHVHEGSSSEEKEHNSPEVNLTPTFTAVIIF